MRNLYEHLVLVLTCALLLSTPMQAQAQQLETFWYSPTTRGEKIDAFKIEMFTGDPLRLGDPGVGTWAIGKINNLGEMDERELMQWMQAVRHYNIAEAEPVLAEMVERLMKKRRQSKEMTQAAYETFVTVASRKNRGLLMKMLRSPLMAPGSESALIEGEIRAAVAGKLVLLNEARGRDYLVRQLDRNLVSTGNRPPASIYARRMIEEMYDVKMLATIERLKNQQRYKDSTELTETLNKITEDMAFKATPIEDIRANITPTADNKAYKKHLELLIYRGEIEDIERIETLDLSVFSDDKEADQASKYRDEVLARLRSKLWLELLEAEGR